ncbi:hypothetical protein [Leptospira sp. GIMC2001]|uniref:hypothetical protein n=1 Tax=Leptospira sp. GIMC2001 TaxID=1513297 RepID=UPI00234B9C83|nr:hypothetical protein [Leptospira sp. GIMC2001]WCL50173.1 hypothetical protein O4O04_04970 [Leptospira sp. GIMC2001]
MLITLNKIKHKGNNLLFGIILLTLFSSYPAIAEEVKLTTENKEPKEDYWRLLVGAFTGQMNLQLQTYLPFGHTDPTTGQRANPTIGRLSGLTQSGALDLAVDGTGPQKGFQFLLLSESLVVQATYARAEVAFSPLKSSGSLPLNTAEGGAGGNVYSTGFEYYHKINQTFAPMVGLSHNGFGAYYKVKNVIGTTVGTNLYQSFPVIDADDRYHSNVGKVGLRIKLPFQSWSITPYIQYAANRYHINVRTTAGAVSGQQNFLPSDPESLVDAWLYRGLGDVSSTDSMTKIPRDDKSGGLVLFMDYKKFISLTINARRNYSRGAWNVSATGLVFFHPNAGIMVNYAYSDPEITLTFNRSWAIGPVFMTSF